MVETFRRRAVAGEAGWMQRLEAEPLSAGKAHAGVDPSGAAMQKVIVDERDLILARKLWEAGLAADGQPVVGVVGAGHVPGIKRYWSYAATPAAAERVEEFMRAPAAARGPSVLGTVAMAAGIGYLSWKRPSAAAVFVGVTTLLAAPSLGLAWYSMRQLGGLAGKVVEASKEAAVAGEADGPAAWQAGDAGRWE
jgi:hypothetical protein